MNNAITTKTTLRTFLDDRMVRYTSVARALGISASHLHHLMEGERPVTPDLAARLAELFGVPVTTFLQEEPAS